MEIILIYIILIVSAFFLSSHLAERIENYRFSENVSRIVFCASLIALKLYLVDYSTIDTLLLCAYIGINLSAAFMDSKYMQIYALYHALTLIPLFTMILRCFVSSNKIEILGLLGFLLIQLLFGKKIYGAADMYTCALNGILLTTLGKATEILFFHMFLAYLILFVIQLCKRNVNKFGNLKEKKPFTPYILASLILML